MQVDFAIITIRADEFSAVLNRFPADRYKGTSGRTYGISQVQTKSGKKCTVGITRSSEQGTGAAQQIANDMMNDLNPQLLLVVGIAGGVPSSDFTLGDVVISTRIVDFDVSKRFEDGTEKFNVRGGGVDPAVSDIAATLPFYQGELQGWNSPDSIKVNAPQVDLSQFDKDEFKAKITAITDKQIVSWYKKVQSSIEKHFNSPRLPIFYTGTIASSNIMLRDVTTLIQWLQAAYSISAVEMETAGVYQATQRIQLHQRYPVMAIRGISDIIGLERDGAWTDYACQTAASFTYAFVKADIITPRVANASAINATNASSSKSQGTGQQSQTNGPQPIDVFISYAEEDEKFKKQLETHLTLLKRSGTIRPWNSQQVKPGLGRDQEIARLINNAQIILLLISPNFLAEDDTYEKEMMRAIDRDKKGEAVRVIPIKIHEVPYGDPSVAPFQGLQDLPRNHKPVDAWRNSDEVWANITNEIRQVCNDLNGITDKK